MGIMLFSGAELSGSIPGPEANCHTIGTDVPGIREIIENGKGILAADERVKKAVIPDSRRQVSTSG